MNEFREDAVGAPFRDEQIKKLLEKKNIKGKNVSVFGYGSGMAGLIGDMLKEAQCEVKVCEDFTACENIGSYLHGGAIVIFTGFSNIAADISPDAKNGLFDKAQNLIETVAKSNSTKFIYLSDYRAYEAHEDNMHLAENERIPLIDVNPVRKLESYVARIMENAKMSYVILRLAMAYGPETNFSNDLHNICNMIANRDDEILTFTFKEFSYIYVNDILTGIMLAVLTDKANTLYNLSSQEKPYNVEEVIAMLRKEFPEACRLSLDYSAVRKKIQKKSSEYVAMSSSKLAMLGWRAKVPFLDGMIILVKSIINSGQIFIFDNSYQGKLETVHTILLSYLLMIDNICKKHNIKYFLGGGTLLGAIRHKGFIPWDDDADVMMLRPDYNKFVQVIKDELPDNIFFQTPDTDPLNKQPFIKLRLDDTVFATAFTSKFPDMHNGIFIDILAHDRTAPTTRGQKKHLFNTLLTRSMVFNKWGNTPITLGGRHPILCKIATALKKILPMNFLLKNMFKVLRKYENVETNFLYDGMGRNLRRGAFPEKWLDEAIEWEFEGYKLPVPKEYDKYLTWLYGDYMKMIPVSERRTSHDIVYMDLGQYSDYQLKLGFFGKNINN